MHIFTLPAGRMRLCSVILGMLALGSLPLSAQIFHPETVNFHILKDGVSFTTNAAFGYFQDAYPVISANLDARLLFKSGEHLFGTQAAFDYKLSGTATARNDGVADIRYYYRFLDFLYAEAFVVGLYNEPKRINYLLACGGGLVMPIMIIPELTVNFGAAGGYAWYSIDSGDLSAPGILASVAVFFNPLEVLEFTLTGYLQILLPGTEYFTVPVKAAVDVKITEFFSVGLVYTFEWDVLENANPFTHDLKAFVRVKI